MGFFRVWGRLGFRVKGEGGAPLVLSVCCGDSFDLDVAIPDTCRKLHVDYRVWQRAMPLEMHPASTGHLPEQVVVLAFARNLPQFDIEGVHPGNAVPLAGRSGRDGHVGDLCVGIGSWAKICYPYRGVRCKSIGDYLTT